MFSYLWTDDCSVNCLVHLYRIFNNLFRGHLVGVNFGDVMCKSDCGHLLLCEPKPIAPQFGLGYKERQQIIRVLYCRCHGYSSFGAGLESTTG